MLLLDVQLTDTFILNGVMYKLLSKNEHTGMAICRKMGHIHGDGIYFYPVSEAVRLPVTSIVSPN